MEGFPMKNNNPSESRVDNHEDSIEKGKNVLIRNFWTRHAQKKSGELMNQGGTGMSESSISAKGAERAYGRGTTIEASKHGAKIYVSPSPRTLETGKKIAEGYLEKNPEAKIRSERVEDILIGNPPQEFLNTFGQMFAKARDQILAGRNMSELSPDDQERVADEAEEGIIQEWLSDANSVMARIYPPRKAAAEFAVLFGRRHSRMAKKLNSGSEIDLLHFTHKTITEPFLVSGVLTRKSDGERITNLEQIGGSLGTLDSWESDIKLDDKGKGSIVVKFRGETYDVDEKVLQELIDEEKK